MPADKNCLEGDRDESAIGKMSLPGLGMCGERRRLQALAPKFGSKGGAGHNLRSLVGNFMEVSETRSFHSVFLGCEATGLFCCPPPHRI